LSRSATASPGPRRARRLRALSLVLALSGTGGCASIEPLSASLPDDAPDAVELRETPFFPQEDYQCGPASLAAVMAAAGVRVSPDELTREVYLPARRGSLQAELLGAARRRGLLAYVLPPDSSALFAQVAAGTPVLVLLNLGVESYPLWHYAVVVGFDRRRGEVILRSGRTERARWSWRRFERSWGLADRWAMAALLPGAMPAEPAALNHVGGCAGLEAAGQLDPARACYEAAARRWPRQPLAQLGLGNVYYARGVPAEAAAAYRRAVGLAPEDGIARNNLAQALLDSGCREAALIEARRALELTRGTPLEQEVLDTLQAIEAAPSSGDQSCRAPAPAP
jgi:tetratricopeptide (TPR) repeat protein